MCVCVCVFHFSMSKERPKSEEKMDLQVERDSKNSVNGFRKEQLEAL